MAIIVHSISTTTYSTDACVNRLACVNRMDLLFILKRSLYCHIYIEIPSLNTPAFWRLGSEHRVSLDTEPQELGGLRTLFKGLTMAAWQYWGFNHNLLFKNKEP